MDFGRSPEWIGLGHPSDERLGLRGDPSWGQSVPRRNRRHRRKSGGVDDYLAKDRKVLARSCTNVQRKALNRVELRGQGPRHDRVDADAVMRPLRITQGVWINGCEDPNKKNVESVGI
jgi:hypothetical protein